MSLADVQRLIELWEQDENFRNQLQQNPGNPEAALQQANINLEPEELQALKDVHLETAVQAAQYIRNAGETAA
jgi:hypothetical protein